MYCPSCGVESTHGLKYCNRCGASLGNNPREANPLGRLVGMLPVAAVCIVGLIGFFVTINHLANGRLEAKAITAIAFCAGLTVFSLVASLIWLLLRLIEPPKAPRSTGGLVGRGHAGRDIDDIVLAQLPAPPIAMPSVTEGTTRNIDQIKHVDRNTS